MVRVPTLLNKSHNISLGYYNLQPALFISTGPPGFLKHLFEKTKRYMHSAESSGPGLAQNFQYLCALLTYQREADIKSHSTQRTITGRKCKYSLITDKSWTSPKWPSRNMPAFHLQCFKWRTGTWININIFNYPPNTWGKKTFQFQKHLGVIVKL